MKITLIGPAYPYRGGISHFNSEMAKVFLKRKDIEVQVLNFKRLYPSVIFPGKTQFDESEKAFHVASERSIDICNPLSWFHAGRMVQEFQPDIVFFQWWTPITALPYLILSRRLKGEKALLVGLMHNISPHEAVPFSQWLFSKFVRMTNLLIVMSRGAEERLRDNFITEEQKRIEVLTLFHPLYDCFERRRDENSTNIERYFENTGYTIQELQETRVVLFFGLIRQYKGLKKLIRSLRILNDHKETILIVAGEFYEQKDEYINIINELGLTTKVILLDHYIPNEDVPPLMNLSDVLVCPYDSGEQSGVIAASLANSLPVITMEGKGIGEVIEDNVTGLLLKNNDPKTIAERIDKFYQLSENTDFRGKIKEATRQYSWDNFITKILEKINAGQKDA